MQQATTVQTETRRPRRPRAHLRSTRGLDGLFAEAKPFSGAEVGDAAKPGDIYCIRQGITEYVGAVVRRWNQHRLAFDFELSLFEQTGTRFRQMGRRVAVRRDKTYRFVRIGAVQYRPDPTPESPYRGRRVIETVDHKPLSSPCNPWTSL